MGERGGMGERPASATYDVFIVHAQDDLEWARRLQARLSQDGLQAALERYLPGDVIISRIEELIGASSTTVFVYSRATAADPMTAAKYAALLTGPDERRFIPALLDDVPIGPFAAARRALDFRGENQERPYRELVEVLRGPPALGGATDSDQSSESFRSFRHHRPEGAREVLLHIGGTEVAFGPADEGPQARHVPGQITHTLEERIWHLDRVRDGRSTELPTKDGALSGRRGARLDAVLRDVGVRLGGVFLDGPAGNALATAVEDAAGRNSALRLGLRVEDDLAELPWETLVPPGHEQPLVLHPHVDLFRHLPANGDIPAIGIRAPLRILAVVAAPDGPGGGPLLDLEAELRRILDSVDDARRHAAAHVRILNEGTLSAVQDALKQERFHVLHISCHAGPGVLLMEDERGGVDEVTATRLARAIPRDQGVPLVVLSGCSTALDVRTITEDAAPTRRTSRDGTSSSDEPPDPETPDDAEASPNEPSGSEPSHDGMSSLEESPDLEPSHGGEPSLDELPGPETSEGEAALAGLARGLSAAGVPAVLAMTAPVTDDYASMLTGALYRELAVRPQPDVLTALSEARRTLEETRRAAPAGSPDADLAEWATPALFLRGPSLPLYDVSDGVDANVKPPRAVMLDRGVVVRAVGDFVGRRAELRILRAALRHHPGVLLHGIGGVGKSSLAAELLGRLGGDAGLVVSLVGRTSPDQIFGAVADKLLAATATAGAPAEPLRELTQFLRRLDFPWQVRLDALGGALAEVPAELRLKVAAPPITLLLDNFEDNVDVNEHFAFLDQELAAFLAAWVTTSRQTKLLVTSRFPFELPEGAERGLMAHHLGPLSWAEARKLMWRLPGLNVLGVEDQQRAWVMVGGHPRTLEYVDALLRGGQARFADVRERLERLLRRRGIADPSGWLSRQDWGSDDVPDAGGDRVASSAQVSAGATEVDRAWVSVSGERLNGVVAEAVTLAVDDALVGDLLDVLDDFARRVLVGVSVYRCPVDRAGLAWPVSTPADPDPAVEERLNRLDERLKLARRENPHAGVEDLGLSAQEAEQTARDVMGWRVPPICEPSGVDAAVGVLAGLGLVVPLADEEHGAAFVVHRWTAATLARPELTPAEQMGSAHRAAAEYWRWRVQVLPQNRRERVDDMVEARYHHHAAGDLQQAARATDWVCRRLHAWGAWGWEEQLYQETLSWFAAGSRQQAAGFHHLGMIAQLRGEYDQALEWYHQSLAIDEELGNRAGMAASYHQLGIIAQLRSEYDQALEWYHQSLTIKEELDDRAGMASSYHQLGIIAQLRSEYDQALEWYHQSLTIKEELDDRAGMASSYHQLGRIAQERGEYDQALEWCRRSLAIEEELGDRAGMASGYHQLGMIAQEWDEYDQALEWYRRSLAIREELGDRAGMATSYHQLGIIAQLRSEYDQALEWYHQSLTIKEELGNRAGMATSYHQLGIIAQERGEYDQALEWYRRSLTIDEDLGSRAGMAISLTQIGILYTETRRADEAVVYTLNGLAIFLELQAPQASMCLSWLAQQRDALGDEVFRRLLAERLDTESIDSLLDLLDRTDE
ncbi:tetratricopeptide repeat protein [Sphaerisporangium dianthi]|uniref:Tetratricopeptide repeat protein n=1 Tax=Sphaerisporangium dianthi TaxID=1436120 RepID=A0ABV9CF83_9ACTN